MNATRLEKPNDCAALAREMASYFWQLVQCYQTHFKKTRQEAIALANEFTDADRQRILEALPDQISWTDFHQLCNASADEGLECWENLKDAAMEELQTGHRAAMAVRHAGQSPWQRAQFLALRTALADQWHSANGIEGQLIDAMAIAQAGFLYWTQTLTLRTSLSSVDGKRLEDEGEVWLAPRLSDAEAMEQATEMMDRFNRIFLRTLRALRDLRRGPVIVQKGGQLNVANQQVNVKQACQV